MLACIGPYGEGVKPIVGAEGKNAVETVKDVNRHVTGTFYSELLLSKFCDDLKENLQADLKTLPQIVLPISNVYMYKEVGFKKRKDEGYGVITFHSTYAPVLKPEEG
jgi:hypothetical protein